MTLSKAQEPWTTEGARVPTTAIRSTPIALYKQGFCTGTEDIGSQQPDVLWIATAIAGVAIRNRKEKEKGLLFSFCLIISDQCLLLANIN